MSDTMKWFLLILLLGILLGWVFPVEGPLDWTYDKYASKPAIHQPAKKFPTRVAPPQPVKEVFIDLNEDDEPEWYWIVPKPTELSTEEVEE